MNDSYLNMELATPRGSDGPEFSWVTRRFRDKDGITIVEANDNPILDTRMYEVEYPDDHKASLYVTAIVENMIAQVDSEGNRHVLFEKIIEHRNYGSKVKQKGIFTKIRNGNKRQ